MSHYSGQVLEENHYYPFGLTISESTNNSSLPVQPYKLTTKELEKAFDLNMYDFGARQFDMQLGRWTGIDPLAELMRRHSPYNYAFNNPVRFIDPDGMAPGDPTDYFNLKGSMVKSIDDGSTDKKLILTEYSKSAEVDEAYDNGAILPVPANESLDKMDNVYDNMDKTGNEYGFAIATDKSSSDVVTSNSDNRVDLHPAYDQLTAQGKTGETDVHGHSNIKNAQGEIVSEGRPAPSGKNGGTPNQAGDTEYFKQFGNPATPKIVLGYKVTRYESNGTVTTEAERRVGFYNSNGSVGNSINYNSFKKAIRKINSK